MGKKGCTNQFFDGIRALETKQIVLLSRVKTLTNRLLSALEFQALQRQQGKLKYYWPHWVSIPIDNKPLKRVLENEDGILQKKQPLIPTSKKTEVLQQFKWRRP